MHDANFGKGNPGKVGNFMLNLLVNPGCGKDCCHSSIYINRLEIPGYSFYFILDEQGQNRIFFNKVCDNSIFFSCLARENSVFFSESLIFISTKQHEPW